MPLEALLDCVPAPAAAVEDAVSVLVGAGLLCWGEATPPPETFGTAPALSGAARLSSLVPPASGAPKAAAQEVRRSPESDLADLLAKAKALAQKPAAVSANAPAAALSEPVPPPSESPVKRSKTPGGLSAEDRSELAARFFRLEDANHYQVLDLAPDATRADIRSAYFALSKRFHPDRLFKEGHEELADQMAAVFARLTEAYDVLGRPARREAYDRSLGPARLRGAAPIPPIHRDRVASQPLPGPETPPGPASTSQHAVSGVASARSRSVSPEERRLQARQRAGARLRAAMGRPTAPPPPMGRLETKPSGSAAPSAPDSAASEAFVARKRSAVEAEGRGDSMLALALWEALASQCPGDAECAEACQRLKPKALEARILVLRGQVRRLDLDQASPEAALAWAELAEAAPEVETLRHVVGLVERHRTLAVRLIPVFDAFAIAHPKDIEAAHLLARVLLQAGLRARARKVLEQAQSLDPADKLTKDLLKVAKT